MTQQCLYLLLSSVVGRELRPFAGKVEKNRISTTDLKMAKGYPTPYDIKSWKELSRGCEFTCLFCFSGGNWELSGGRGRRCPQANLVHHLLYIFVIFVILFFFSILSNFISTWKSYSSFFSLPHSTRKEGE